MLSFADRSQIDFSQGGAIAIDKQNIRWFATEMGVLRFDGSNWTSYTTTTTTTTASGNNNFHNRCTKCEMVWHSSWGRFVGTGYFIV